MYLSIVIPVFEESKKVSIDVEMASSFLQRNNFAGEIIVVDDGSSDDTAEVAKNCNIPAGLILKVERYEIHRGKGHAIRTGMKQANGEYVMFADSGGCVPYKDVLQGLKLLEDRACDIAHGTRKIPQSHIKKGQSWYRRICSAIFHWFVIHFMKVPSKLTDTQCGFKIYKGDIARNLYKQCVTDGFMIDIEVIMRAQKQGYRIKEFPIEWTCDRDSRLSPTRSLWNVLSELRAIKRALKN